MKHKIGNYRLTHGLLEGWFYEHQPTGETVHTTIISGHPTWIKLERLRWKKRIQVTWDYVTGKTKRRKAEEKARRDSWHKAMRETKFVFPVIKRKFPELIGEDIVGVQPMTGGCKYAIPMFTTYTKKPKSWWLRNS